MQKGVEDSTNMRYTKNSAEYWNTLKRLRMLGDKIWTFPTNDWLLPVYIVNYQVVREKISTCDAMRNKLRAIDHVAQGLEVKQEHHMSPALDAVIKCRKNTIGMTVERTEHIMRNEMLTTELDSWDKKSIKKNWMICNIDVSNDDEIKCHQMSIKMKMAMTMSLRGAEQLKNEDEEWKECENKFWRSKKGEKFISSKCTKNQQGLVGM